MFELEIKNVENKAYREFIDLVGSLSDKFLLVERKDMECSDNLGKVFKRLEGSFIEMKEQSQWPGTMLGDDKTAKVYYYKIDDNSKCVLKEESDALFSWQQPNLPEDLSFIKDDKPWVSVCSHEGLCDIASSSMSVLEEILSIDGVEKKRYF